MRCANGPARERSSAYPHGVRGRRYPSMHVIGKAVQGDTPECTLSATRFNPWIQDALSCTSPRKSVCTSSSAYSGIRTDWPCTINSAIDHVRSHDLIRGNAFLYPQQSRYSHFVDSKSGTPDRLGCDPVSVLAPAKPRLNALASSEY